MAGPLLLLLFMVVTGLRLASCITDPQDAAVLLSLMNQWENTPPSWGQSNDPCGTPWEGIVCNGSRVTVMSLSTMGLKGTLSGDIGHLSKLQSLDLSYNSDLGGALPPNIGNLKQLTTLILAGCSFNGIIPSELGNLPQLSFLALNSNQFSGTIPASLGGLSNLYWFDLADNQLTGSLPISTNKSPGLDLLVNAQHFHFNKNQLSGKIPENLFSSAMILIHVFFDANNFTGDIPASIGLVQSLQALRLDNNSLSGPVPSSINNLTSINELNLANNQLTGPIPNLTGMNNLNYVDLSNNNFDPTEVPGWFSTIQSLTSLVIESGRLYGQMPVKLFSFSQLGQVLLNNNSINGTLDLGNNISPQLQIVSLENNSISSATLTASYNGTLVLVGNPVCNDRLSNTVYCRLQQQSLIPYSTSLASCGSNSCPPDQSLSPQSCQCAYPYEGIMTFRAPFFRDVTNSTLFQQLEMNLWMQLRLTPGSVSLSNLFFNNNNYLQMQVKLFPSTGMYFNQSEIIRIGFDLSSQTFKPPKMFGPYYFIASQYPFPGGINGRSSISTGAVAGIAAGCSVLIVGLLALGIYALKQKKRAEKATQLTKPFASWGSNVKDSGDAPQLKGARWFSFEELKKITNNFSENNELGSGGYGKVYRGIISSGQIVAVKRAQQGSMQGGHEFKTEIELLSRVHHRNLVSLVGFCFELGEQMLVYEFIPNGTLRERLTGKGRIQLDWKRRLGIALGSARGLAYLHELANPPIIHRDVKTPNILLDENLNAKVADFGLSKLVSDSQKGHVSTQVKGTLGYLDPEYYMTQQLSDKSDVYSFGVVMLELITAKQPIEKGKYIVREVRIAMDKNDEEYYGLKEMMDPAIRNASDLTGFRRFVELALRCVEETAANRPTMNDVVKEIEMMLQDDTPNINSNSTSSSTRDFGSTTDASHHPYDHPLPIKNVTGDSFEYSGGYSFVGKIEPK